MKRYWLIKTEPSTYSLDDLRKSPKQITAWEGVRNYQARNFLRDEMKKGDMAFFYHSSCAVPAIMAIVEIIKDGYADETAFNPESPYFDPSSKMEAPRWYKVDVKLIRALLKPITLSQLRANPELNDLLLLRKGNRLSVLPVSEKHWNIILNLE